MRTITVRASALEGCVQAGNMVNQLPSTTKLSTRGQVVIPEEIRNRLGLQPAVQFVVIGECDVVVLKTLKPPKLEELKPLLDKVQKAAEAAGVTPEDVEQVIAEVRASE